MTNSKAALPCGAFYGWYIVAISFVVTTVVYGVYFAWPVFYVAILGETGWSRAETALIFSVASLVYGFASPVAGLLFDRFGPRRLFSLSAVVLAAGALGASYSTAIWQFCLFYGILVALGTICAGFIPNSAMVANWFVRRRATALGIAQAGSRDAFLLAPLVQLSVLALGWRPSYQILAGVVVAVVVPLAMFLRARPEDLGLVPDGASSTQEGQKRQASSRVVVVDHEWASRDWTLSAALRERRFWALFAIMVGAGFAGTSLVNHLVAVVTDIGFTAMFAASLLAVYGVAAILGRLCGVLSDVWGRETTLTLAALASVVALSVLLITREGSAPWLLYLFIALYGFGNGLHTPAYTAGVADLFQGRQFGTIIGALNVGVGLAASVGTWLYGLIFDLTESYAWAVVITMFAGCAQIAAIWVAAPRKVRRIAWRAPAQLGPTRQT